MEQVWHISTRQPRSHSQSKLALHGRRVGPVVGRDEVAPQRTGEAPRAALLPAGSGSRSLARVPIAIRIALDTYQPAPPCQLPLCGERVEAAESRISIHPSLSAPVSLFLLFVCYLLLGRQTVRPSFVLFCSERVAHFISCRTSASTPSTLPSPNLFSLAVHSSFQSCPARAVTSGSQ